MQEAFNINIPVLATVLGGRGWRSVFPGKVQPSIGCIKCENNLSETLYCLILLTGVLRANKNIFTAFTFVSQSAQ
jgi:hypothetical protein